MIKFRFRKSFPLVFASFFVALAGGCAPSGSAPGASSDNRSPVRGVASSFLAARAFDRATLALQRDDSAGLQRAGADLRRASNAGFTPRVTGAFVAQLTTVAGQTAQLANLSSGDEMIDLLKESEGKYRAALAFAPLKSPEKVLDAVTLNALGYFLADRGTTRDDFARAVWLTRAAYINWDISGRTPELSALSRAQGPQDSLAWALFRLGEFDEARRLQEQVWDMSRGMGAADTTGEIPFHLGEIYRALGLEDKAREAYLQAILLPNDSRTRGRIASALKILELSQV